MNLFVNRKPKSKLFKPDDLDVWVTAKGERIPITNMENQHLINTIQMLQRGKDASGNSVKYLTHFLPSLIYEGKKRGIIYE